MRRNPGRGFFRGPSSVRGKCAFRDSSSRRNDNGDTLLAGSCVRVGPWGFLLTEKSLSCAHGFDPRREPGRTHHPPLRRPERARRPARQASEHRPTLGKDRPHPGAMARTADVAGPPERCRLGSKDFTRPCRTHRPGRRALGVLLVGLGAVATTVLAGVEHARRGSGRRSARSPRWAPSASASAPTTACP